jgi:hypothetical protein
MMSDPVAWKLRITDVYNAMIRLELQARLEFYSIDNSKITPTLPALPGSTLVEVNRMVTATRMATTTKVMTTTRILQMPANAFAHLVLAKQ